MRRRRLYVFGFVLALFVFVLPGTVVGQEGVNALLVSQNPDTRDAHEALWGADTAFATIQAAVDRAEGDPENAFYTILVEQGTYTEQVSIDAGSNIWMRGDFGAAGGSGRPVVTIDGTGGSYAVRIRGTGSGVTLDTLDITGGLLYGIRIVGEGQNQVAAPTIMNCVIEQNGDGIDCDTYSVPRITNCMVVDNTGSGIVCRADSAPSLMNNTISGNNTGIEVLDEITLDITNTIAYGNTDGLDLDVTAATMELTVLYSDIDTANSNFPIGPGPGNINADPLFTDSAAGDYRLLQPDPGDNTTWSPCIDAGTDAGTLSVDFEGDGRYDVGVIANTGVGPEAGVDFVDIGADEYVLVGAIIPPVAYAIPDPTKDQPPGGLVFIAYGQGNPVNIVEGLSSTGTLIATTRLAGGGGLSEYVIAVNATPIDELTGDGTADILVDGGSAGTFLIDTIPPTVGPGPPNPYSILDNHNDTIDVSDLNVVGWWEANEGLPTPNVPVDADVLTDGVSFFFNTGARAVDGSFPDGGLSLEIDLVVDAIDPGVEPSGFDVGRARSGRLVVRSETHGDQFIEPLPGGPGPATTWTLQFRPAVEGMYRIEIVAEDRAGNVSLPEPIMVYWDKTPPATRISSRPRDPEPSTRASLTWRLAGALAPTFNTVLQYWDELGGVWATASPFTYFLQSNVATYSGLDVGIRYRFTVLGIDDAGNLETTVTSNQWAWTVSNAVPNTIITSGPPRVTTDERAVMTFREVPEDPSVEFVWSLSSSLTGEEPYEGQGGSNRVSRPAPGSPDAAVQYIFSVSAWKDHNLDGIVGDGEYDPTPATYTWTVVPPAGPDDPGVPPMDPDLFPPEFDPLPVLERYGVGGYVDAPGEQPVKYMREEARRK